MTFEELQLTAPLHNALKDLGFTNPTPIQEKVYPVILSGKDVIGIAQTGTGKTFAYLLPLLRQLKFSDQKQPRVLIVVPTRELVLQVTGEIEKLAKYMNIRFAGVYGGANITTQKQIIYNGLDILVATPGRLADLALSGVLRLSSVQKLVIDEVDEMLNLGFKAQVISILETLPAKRQNLMFSATLSEGVDKLINDYFLDPQRIEIELLGTPIEKIIQSAYIVPNSNTKFHLLDLLLSNKEELSRVLVFVQSKRAADNLREKLNRTYPGQIGIIHSNKAQNQRFNALKKLEEGTSRVLIATDIIARGLDITDITHVINFDTPEVPGDYIHRIGRTGRADKDGVAISLFTEREENILPEIEEYIGMKIPVLPLPENLVVSQTLTEDERNELFDKDYLKKIPIKLPKGAFHEKKDKNKKVNLGGPKKRNPKFSKSGKRIKR